MFYSTRIKLTAWYLIIIMCISFLFSFIIYQNVNNEYNRIEMMHQKVRQQIADGYPIRRESAEILRIDPDLIQHSRFRLISTLLLINVGILILAGTAGYFLAGRTLKPIQNMLDEQHRFIADASHELKTPITSLRSEIEINLRNKKMTLPDAKKILISNLEEVINLQTLSERLLGLAQNDSKQMTVFSLTKSIENAIKKVDGLAGRKRITITKNLAGVSYRGDKDALEEVFVILLDNAIKFSNKNSEVVISLIKEKSQVFAAITDTGIGISPRDIPHIFERFYQVETSRSSQQGKGYGLGLSLAQKSIKAHNGEIHVKSNLGKGTTFTVRLPL